MPAARDFVVCLLVSWFIWVLIGYLANIGDVGAFGWQGFGLGGDFAAL